MPYRNARRVSLAPSFALAGLVFAVLDLAKYDAALYSEKLLKKRLLDEKVTVIVLTNAGSEAYLQPESFLISDTGNGIASYYLSK